MSDATLSKEAINFLKLLKMRLREADEVGSLLDDVQDKREQSRLQDYETAVKTLDQATQSLEKAERLHGMPQRLDEAIEMLETHIQELERTDGVGESARNNNKPEDIDALVKSVEADVQAMSQVKPVAAAPKFKLPVDADKLSSAGKVWMVARNKVRTDIEQLRAAFLGTFTGSPHEGELGRRFDHRTHELMELLDPELGTTLQTMSQAQDEAAYSALAARARALIKRYKFFTANDPAIPLLATNPFRPCPVGSTLTESLDAVQATIS